MALVNCPKCGNQVSDKAKDCPHCNLNFEEYEKEQIIKRKLKEEKEREEELQRRQEEIKKKEEEQKRKQLQKICPECGESIDKNSTICPICAYPIKEEAEKAQKEEEKRKLAKKKILLISLVLFIMGVVILSAVKSINTKQKYEQALKHFELEEYELAYELFGELEEYKESKEYSDASYLAMRLKEIESTMSSRYLTNENNLQIDNWILSESKKIPKLRELRESVIDKMYVKAENSEFTAGKLDERLETIHSIIELIKTERDVVEFEERYKDYKYLAEAIVCLDNEEYEEAYNLCKEISDNNIEPSKFKKEYIELYDNCATYLDNWKTTEYLGESIQLSFKYSVDEYDAENYAPLNSPYLKITKAGMPLENEDLVGDDTGRCYKNLICKNGEIQFEYHFNGSGKPYHKVRCTTINDKIVVTIDGKECITYVPGGTKSNEAEKVEPYIGMSSHDAEYNCSWGKPSKKNVTETKYGKSEQWVYRGYGYLYIENGSVTAIQK